MTDLISSLHLKPGDVIEVKSIVTVQQALDHTLAGDTVLKGTVENGKRYNFHYNAMGSVRLIKRTHPTPKRGDIWLPGAGMLPVFFDGDEFKFPSGTSRTISSTGILAEESFFAKYPGARFVVNTGFRPDPDGY